MTTQPLPAAAPYVTFYDYVVYDFFQKMTPELCEKVIDFWKRNQALPAGAEPAKRAMQVALMTFRKTGELAGVSTVYEGEIEGIPDRHYFYRMFIQPADRVAELMRVMTISTYEILKALQRPDKPKSFIIVSENLKLMRPGLVEKFRKNGYIIIGKNRAGHDVVQKVF